MNLHDLLRNLNGGELTEYDIQACRAIVDKGVEITDLLDKNEEDIMAVCLDHNDAITALTVGTLMETGLLLLLSETTCFEVKNMVMAAFYLGYRTGLEQGDLSVWEKEL